MKKAAIVCRAADVGATIARLCDLGVLHVVPAGVEARGDRAAGDRAAGDRAAGDRALGDRHDVAGARQVKGLLDRAIAALPAREGKTAFAALPASDGTAATGTAVPPTTFGTAEADVAVPPVDLDTARRIETLATRRSRLAAEIESLAAECAHTATFGDFDPQRAQALSTAGLDVAFCEFPSKKPPATPPGAVLEVLTERRGTARALWIAPQGSHLEATRVPMPERSRAACAQALADARAQLDATERELASLAGAREALLALREQAAEAVGLAEALSAMGDAGDLAWIEGYCPLPAVARVEAAAKDGGFAVTLREPRAGEDVPTLLHGPRWVRQVHSVLEGIGISPGYGEPDVSPLFLVFLLLFAAMLIGDAGYGALLLLASWWLARGRSGAALQPIRLLRSVGASTLVWGAITGVWFALPNLPGFLDALRIEWLAGADPRLTARHVMTLCFFLGALHLTLAHGWAALRAGRSAVALAQLGWILSTWCMFFLARTMVLGEEFPPAMTPLAIAGVVLIVLFMTPRRQLRAEWFQHAMLPLNLVSNFVDVVSYLRLFAVGVAGVAVAGAFNDIAAKVAAGGVLGVVAAALVAVFGHTLNLLLCAMGVLVHAVRLNTLEFSAHLGLQWSGVPYAPLRRAGALPQAGSDRTTC